MSIGVILPAQLRGLAGDEARIELAGHPSSVGEALEVLRDAFPLVYDRLVTERGEVRPHVNLFVGTTDIRRTGGLDTPLAADDEIVVLPSVSGG